MPTDRKLTYGRRTKNLELQPQSTLVAEEQMQPSEAVAVTVRTLKGMKRQMARYHIALSVSSQVVNVKKKIFCVN